MARGGKRSTAWEPGKAPVKQKGMKNKTTLVRENLGLTGWERLCNFVVKDGADKYVDTMMELDGRDFIVAYNAMTEYVKPKLQRTTVEGDPDKPIIHNIASNLSFEQLYQLKYGKLPG